MSTSSTWFEAQAAEQLLIARIHIDHGDAATAILAQITGHAGKSAEEGRVHHGTAIQVKNEVAQAALDLLLHDAL